MSLTVLSTEMPAALVHNWLELHIPRVIRLVPCLYNRWYQRACLGVLAERKADLTRQAWVPTNVPLGFVETVSAAIVDEYYWPRGTLFHPEDECWVLFHFWRQKWVDSLELPCCIMRIEQELGAELPAEIVLGLHKMLFGHFCRELVQLVQASAGRAR